MQRMREGLRHTPRRKKNGPTQEDIAREVGLSVSTISRALSNARGISDDVRRRVVGTAAKMGYRARVSEGDLFDRAVIVTRMEGATTSRTFVYQAILAGVQEALQPIGASLDTEVATDSAPLSGPLSHDLDPSTALIFVGLSPGEDVLKTLRVRKVPVVLVNASDPGMTTDIVTPNNFLSGRLAAQHLLDHGHRRFLALTTQSRSTAMRRTQGFQFGISERAVDGAGLVASIEIDAQEPDQLAQQVIQALDVYASRATAMFCTSDILAFHAIQGLRAIGKRAPKDMSVVSFDNTPVSTMISPQLSSIKVDWRLVGMEAVNLLRRRSKAPDGPSVHLQLATEVETRDSVMLH